MSLTSILAQVWSQTFHLVLAELEVSSGSNGNIFIFLNRQSLQHQSSSSFNFLQGFACPNCIFNFMFHYRWNVIKVSAPFVPTSSCFLISNQKRNKYLSYKFENLKKRNPEKTSHLAESGAEAGMKVCCTGSWFLLVFCMGLCSAVHLFSLKASPTSPLMCWWADNEQAFYFYGELLIQ